MNKIILTGLLICMGQQIFGETFYDQLLTFNPNWVHYSDKVRDIDKKTFDSDADYVYAHLSEVLPILKMNPIDHLDKSKRAKRRELIDLLDNYRKAKKFPINYYIRERIPVFIDEHDTHCAVGFLLQQSGREDIARRISQTDNYVWVKDIEDPELIDWQQASGLSLAELKLIQGAYDFYEEFAFISVNRYEKPQKPFVVSEPFGKDRYGMSKLKEGGKLWCYGEGKEGVLNGRWIQNYTPDLPWIVGYFRNGKRTGQWKEYYQGTKQLCRTENWRNDELNGIRTRYDRQGKIIETIEFNNGNAVCKTNIDFQDSLKYKRIPLNDKLVDTEVYTFGGRLIAKGVERIYNPGNLSWFQDIELTALNSAALIARDQTFANANNDPILPAMGNTVLLQQSAQLVKYHKVGDWVYYRETYDVNQEGVPAELNGYDHYEHQLKSELHMVDGKDLIKIFDSLKVSYDSDFIVDFCGYAAEEPVHIKLIYTIQPSEYRRKLPLRDRAIIQLVNYPTVKSVGKLNDNGAQVGLWKHFNNRGQLMRTENFIIPRKEEGLVNIE